MAKIGVARSGCENERIVKQATAAIQQDTTGIRIYANHRRKQRGHLGAPTHEIADRPGDFGSRKRCGRDLIKQRLKKMVVSLINQRNAQRQSSKSVDGFEPAKSAANYDDAMAPSVTVCCRREAIFLILTDSTAHTS